jgi:hypothetical protein
MPQVQFQVNVATVEYKYKKQSTNVSSNPYGGGIKYGGNQIESPRNYGGLSSTMPIGIENSKNDRGDEINLDELQRYIGGGGAGRF